MSRQDSNPGVNSNVNNNVIEKSLKPNVPSKPHHLQPGTKASLSKDNITPKGWSRQTNFTFDAKNVETADKSITQPESMFSPKWRPVPRVSKKQNKREDIKTKDYNANQELSSPTTGHKSLSRPHSKSLLLEEEQQPGFGSLKRMWSQKTKDGDKLPGLSSPPTLRTQAKEREHSPLSKNNSVDKSTSSDKTDSPQSLSRSESSSSNGSVRTASFKDRAHGSWHCVISHSPTNTGSGFLSEAFPSQIPPNEPAVTESSRNKKFDHSILMPRPFHTSAIDEESTFTSVRAVKSQSSNHHTSSKQISPITERKEVRRPSSSLSDDSNTSPAEELDSDEREMRQARKLGTRVTRFDNDGNMYSVDPRTGKVEYVDKNITNERIPEAIYSDSPFVDSSKTNISHRGKITLENAGKRNGSDRNSHRSLHSNQRSHESSSDEAPPPLLPRERGSRHARSRAPLVSSLSGGRQSSLTSYSMYPPKNRGSRYATSTRTDYGGVSPDSAVPPPIMPRGEQMPAISQDYTPMSASGSDNPFPGLRTRTSTSSLNSFLDQAGPAYEPMDASGSYEPMEPKDEDEMFCYSAAVDPAKPRLSLREYHEIDPDPDVPVGQLTTTVVYDPGLVPPPPDCDPPTLPEGVTRTHSRSKSHPNPPGSPPPLPPLNPNTGAQKKLNYIEVEIGTAMSSRDVEAKRKSQKTNYTEVIIGGGPVVSGKDDGDGKKGKSVKGKLMSMFSSKHHDGYLSEGDVISHKITKICATLLLLFTVATLVVGYRNENNKRVKCGESSFFNATRQACQACGICEPGTYIKRTCSGTRDYHCKKCEPGHFSTRYTRLPGKCRMCSRCGDRPVIKRCTKTSDTVCGDCPLGTFMSFGRCISCGYCFPDFGIDIPREPACEKPQIPASHRCTVLIVDPYDPPYLVSRADDDGNQYFVSSYTLLPKKSDTPHDNARLLIDDEQTSQGESHTTTIPTTTKRVNMVTSVLANIPRHTAKDISSRLVKYGETSYEYWLAGAGIIISLCIALTLGCISVIYRRRLSQTVTQKPYRPIVKNRQQYYAHFVDEHTKHSLKSALLDNA